MKNNYIIGIDPDTDKSGISLIDKKNKKVCVGILSFPILINRVIDIYQEAIVNYDDPIIIVEASHLIKKSNWHQKQGKRGEKIAKDVGACHQTGKLIIEMLRFKGCEVVEQRPLKKCWKGKDGKITHNELKQIIENAGYSFPYNRSNQEQRDACLLAWNHAGLPMRIKNKIK